MIACVSPAEVNAEETLATLRYADRTKKIKNKPMVNIDPNIAAMERLKSELATVKLELLALRGENNSHTTSYGYVFINFCLAIGCSILLIVL